MDHFEPVNLSSFRYSQNDQGTVSLCSRDDTGEFFCFFFEPAKPIPEGRYLCRRCDHPNHGLCFELQDVPGHTAILIHPGNGALDTKGCLLPGFSLGLFKKYFGSSYFGVLQSAKAYATLMELEKGTNEFYITIKDCFKKQEVPNG